LGSTFVAYNNKRYYDFFSESVPLGQFLIEYGEARGWDTLTAKEAFDSSVATISSLGRYVSNKLNGVPETTAKVERAEPKEHKERLKSIVAALKTNVRKDIAEYGAIARHRGDQFTEGVADLVRKAEAALADKPPDFSTESNSVSSQLVEPPPYTALTQEGDPQISPTNLVESTHVYESPLPLGFEPPPGYSKPAPPKKTSSVTPESTALPLIAPAVLELSASDPIISHLASTIDNLASFLNSNPSVTSNAKSVLDVAKEDLTGLATRIDTIREEERVNLEVKLDEQAGEYTKKLLELELEAQERLEGQEEEFKKYFEEEKVKFVHYYRERLENELRAQTELINER
jgi:MICOS complex subunit MIC60